MWRTPEERGKGRVVSPLREVRDDTSDIAQTKAASADCHLQPEARSAQGTGNMHPLAGFGGEVSPGNRYSEGREKRGRVSSEAHQRNQQLDRLPALRELFRDEEFFIPFVVEAVPGAQASSLEDLVADLKKRYSLPKRKPRPAVHRTQGARTRKRRHRSSRQDGTTGEARPWAFRPQ